MSNSKALSGNPRDFEGSHSAEEVKRIAIEHGVSTYGTKRQIVTRLFAQKEQAEFPRPTQPSESGAVYHVSTQRSFPTWKEVKGIFVGGCVARGVGSSFRARAHAHCFTIDPHFGWICFRSIKRVGEVEGHTITRPSALLWHEYAHILTPNHGHDDAWRATMKLLGQPIPEQYKKKKRPRLKYKFACQACGHRWTGYYTETCPKCGKQQLAMTPIRGK